jgi:3-oxoacyl-[acyl-carrier-protein] synthase-3
LAPYILQYSNIAILFYLNNNHMYHSKLGLGFYVPPMWSLMTICQKIIDTNDEWIQERTGIQERRHIIRGEDTTTTMGVKAAEVAIARSVAKEDIDFVVLLH